MNKIDSTRQGQDRVAPHTYIQGRAPTLSASYCWPIAGFDGCTLVCIPFPPFTAVLLRPATLLR